MSRVFIFAFQNCCGETGGGQGVVYRLYQANLKYNLFNDVFFVFGDRVIHNTSSCGELAKRVSGKDSECVTWIKKNIPGSWFVWRKRQQEHHYLKFLKALDSDYHFSSEDVFIFNDLQLAFPFIEEYSFRSCALINHAQGSVYNEWVAHRGRESETLKNYYNRIYIDTIKKMKYIGFPSKGAMEALLQSEPTFTPYITEGKVRILYNGVYCPDPPEIHDECPYLSEISDINGYKFATVAVLNEAKAVERIPMYLNAVKEAGIFFKWILIGNGVNNRSVLREIKKYGLEENIIWIQDYIRHEHILKILSMTDFYILFHKYSIFDLSTLEAMHYGNIPILTPVGGNKEVIVDSNGIFVSDFSNADSLLDTIRLNMIEHMKQKNIQIQSERFNDYSFLKGYYDLCNSF